MKRRVFALVFFVSIITAASSPLIGAAEKAGAVTPVAAVRALFEALADPTEAKVKALTLPHPKLKVLYAAKPGKEEQEALRQAAAEDMRVLRPGETVPMEGGVMTVPPPTNNLVFVHGPHMLIPVPVSRVDGRWKVNAGPLIAAKEKAAAEAKAANKK